MIVRSFSLALRKLIIRLTNLFGITTKPQFVLSVSLSRHAALHSQFCPILDIGQRSKACLLQQLQQRPVLQRLHQGLRDQPVPAGQQRHHTPNQGSRKSAHNPGGGAGGSSIGQSSGKNKN